MEVSSFFVPDRRRQPFSLLQPVFLFPFYTAGPSFPLQTLIFTRKPGSSFYIQLRQGQNTGILVLQSIIFNLVDSQAKQTTRIPGCMERAIVWERNVITKILAEPLQGSLQAHLRQA